MNPYNVKTIVPSVVICSVVSFFLSCTKNFAQNTETLPDGTIIHRDPLPELNSEQVKKLDPRHLILKESYGNEPGSVKTSKMFTASEPSEIEIGPEGLVIGHEQGGDNPHTMANIRVDQFPATLDLKMNMHIEQGGFVVVTAYIPFPDKSAKKLIDKIMFYPKSANEKITKTTVPLDLEMTRTYRFVLDEEGKGRLYFMDDDTPSIPIGGYEHPGAYCAIEISAVNATVFIHEAALYSDIPVSK